MRLPMLYKADSLAQEWPMAQAKSNYWTLARPLDGGPWWQRFVIAFGVFTGRYDAIRWEDE